MLNFRLIITLLLLLPFAIGAISIAPWIPTRQCDYKRILDIMKLKGREKIYEIGCGSGGISFYIGENIKNKIIGIEINFFLYIFCRVKNILKKQNNITFINKNIFKYNLSDADIIYLYGLPQNNYKLVEKFQKELKKGTRIISYVFEIPELKLIEQNKPTKKDLSIFVYEI